MSQSRRSLKYQPAQKKSAYDAYFGIRNGTPLDPQPNINFDLKFLDRTETRLEAEAIVNVIDSLFKTSEGKSEKYSISMIPAGFAGVIFSFADMSNVEKVYASESDKYIQELLNNNIKAYGLQSKIYVGPYYENEKSSILYYDLIKNPQLDYKKILQEGKFPLYAGRVPVDFKLQKVPGYSCTSIDLSETTPGAKSKLLLCEQGEETDVDESVDPKWLNKLITQLDVVLSKIIKSKEERQAYFREDLMTYWIQCFTSKTFDPNLNYEVLEMIGDRFMKAAFADYLIQRIKTISEGELTEAQNYYLTTIPQSGVSRSLGFGQLIRLNGEIRDKILEDVLEAFIGALFRVSEEVAGGRGYYNVFMMIVSIYKTEPLEERIDELSSGQDKSVVFEIFSKIRLKAHEGNLVESVTRDESGFFKATLSVSTKVVNFFRSKNITITPIIGKGSGKSERSAKVDAYGSALEYLRSRGVAEKWLDEQKEIFTFDRPEYQPYLVAARARLAKEGFIKMNFSTPASTSSVDNQVVQLLGVRQDGSQKILATTQGKRGNEGKLEVLRAYAEGR